MPAFDPKTQELLVGMMMMAGALVLVAIGIQVITIFRRRAMADTEDTEADLARTFEEAYAAGELSTDEYRKVKDRLEQGPILSPIPSPPPTLPDPSDPGPTEVEPEPTGTGDPVAEDRPAE